jgi:hypothetical protein
MGISEGVPWANIERRALSEEGGTSTAEERRRRMKSAGRQASRTSDREGLDGVIYCKDCLKRSTLTLD